MKDRVLRPVNIGTLFLTSKDLCIPDLNFYKLNFNNISRLLCIFNSSTNENIMGSHHLQNVKAFFIYIEKTIYIRSWRFQDSTNFCIK